MTTTAGPRARGFGLMLCAAVLTTGALGAAAQDGGALSESDLPSPKKLIAGAMDYCGGQEKLEAIKSIDLKASAAVPGMGTINVEMKRAGDDRMLMSQSMDGQEMGGAGQVGKVGWQYNPMMGGYQLLSDEDLADMANQTNMTSTSLLVMEDSFKDLKTVGKTTFEERECYQVHGTTKSGEETDIFFDVENKSLVGQKSVQDSQFGPVDIKVVFRDWKEIEGINTFTTLAVDQGGQLIELKLDSVKFNTLKMSDFTIPEDVQKMVDKQKSAEGESGSGTKDGGGN